MNKGMTLLVLLVGIFGAAPVSGQEIRVEKAEQIITVSQDEIINQDFIAAGKRVDIAGNVEGDNYIVANRAIIDGNINGDEIIVAGQATLNGNIQDNLRVIAGKVMIEGSVGGNTTIVATDVYIGPQVVMSDSVVIIAGNVVTQGEIKGNATIISASASIDGTIDGNVSATTQQLQLGQSALIKGNVSYTSQNQALVAKNAQINGQISYTQNQAVSDNDRQSQIVKATQQIFSVSKAAYSITLIIVALIVSTLMPNYAYRTINMIESKPLYSMVIGSVCIITAPVVCTLLMISIIGLPLGVIGACIVMALLIMSQSLFIYWLGARFIDRIERQASKLVTIMIGIGIYYILTSITIVGIITSIVGSIMGVGGVMLAKHKTYNSARKLKII